jgi:predicted ATPase
MTIKSISINNYRSIEKLDIDIQEIDNKKCSILLSKNESGKSNILKAISLINDNTEQKINYDLDCNKNENIEITFNLDFDKSFFETEFKKYEKIPNELIEVEKIEKKVSVNKNDTISRLFYIYLNKLAIIS